MAASVSLSSFWIFKAGGLVTDADSATWRVGTPTPADTITWNVGPNDLDATPFALVTATETKFNFPPPGAAPAAKALVGIAVTQVGVAAGTVAVTTGTGTSGFAPPLLLGGPNPTCSWNLSLSVTPGAPRAAVSYDTQAEADDPIRLDRSLFSDNTAGRTSLYIPIALDALAHEANGGGGLSVAWVTGAGRVELLNLQSAGSRVSATSDDPGLARFYRIDTPYENPMARRERPYALADLRDLLSARMSGGVLGERLMLGVLLENIPVPSVEIGPAGVVAELHVASRLFESQKRKRRRYPDPRKPKLPGKGA